MKGSSRVSLLALFIAGLSISLSLYWIPSWQKYCWELYYTFSGERNDELAEPWIAGSEISQINQTEAATLAVRQELAILKRENKALKIALRKTSIQFKEFSEDLRFIQTEIVGPFFRQNQDVWMINMGETHKVRRGDVVVHNMRIIGKIIGVAQTCSLMEIVSSINSVYFIRIENLEGEYFWEGLGGGYSEINVRAKGNHSLVGRKVYISAASSLGGGFYMGEIESEKLSDNAGWKQLKVSTRKPAIDDILYIVQELEPKSKGLFEKRGKLKELKDQVKELEEQKLRLEMLKD